MKKLFVTIALSLFLLSYSLLTANAAVESIDFSTLPTGTISQDGIDLGEIDIFGQLLNDIFDESFDGLESQRAIGVFPGTIIFKFAPSLLVDEITATIRTNAAPATLQAIGTDGTVSFSLTDDTQLSSSFTETLNGIGVIDTVLFSGWESFITSLSYNTMTNSGVSATPIPGASILLASGLLGLAGLSRRKNS